MYPKLLHLFGSFYINSFGVCLALGLIMFIYLVSKDSAVSKLLSMDDVINLTIYTAVTGVISGRLLYILTEFPKYNSVFDIVNLSNGGGSVLGTMIGCVAYISLFAYRNNFQVLELLDIGAIYAPIIHATARIGCFLAGCCFGCESSMPWAIMYTNPDTVAPLHISIHPTQIYSAVIFFLIFLFMYFNFAKIKPKIVGLAFNAYLILSSLERFLVDFIRGDRTFLSTDGIFKFFSFHQILAISFIALGSVYFIVINSRKSTIKA